MSAPGIAARLEFLPSVRVRLGPERGFVFDERSGHVYSLNETAAFAAARLQQAATLAAVVQAVTAAFDVEEAVARRDLLRFTGDLVAEGLARLEETDG